MCMILVCISCFVMFMDISMRLHDRFYRLIAFGLGVTYIFQVFLTIGGGSKFIPLTGVTLPLISYGGSSVLTTLIMFAIIEGLCIVKEEEEQEELVPTRKQKGSKRIGAEDALTGKKGKRKRNRSQSNRKNEEADEVIN